MEAVYHVSQGLYQREMASLLQRLNRQQNAYMKAKENMPSHCEGVHGGQHGVGTEKVGKRRRLVPAPLGCTQVRETLTDYSEKKYPRHAKCVKQTAYDTRPPPPQGKGAREAPGRDLDSGSGDPPLLARLRDARQRWAEAKRAAEVAGVRAKGLSGQTAWGPEAPDEAREEEEEGEEKEECAARILFEAVVRARAEEAVDAEEGQEGEGGEEVAREDMVAWLVRRVTSTRTSAGRGAEGTEARQEEQPPRPCESGLRRMEGHPGEQQDSTRVKSALQRLKLRVRVCLSWTCRQSIHIPFLTSPRL